MNIAKQHRFNDHVTGLELGHGIIGRPLMCVFCYLVGDTLIDCCQTRMARALRAFARDRTVARLLLTHHHEDHSGNAALVARECGAEVFGHPVTAIKMNAVGPILPYQHIIWGPAQNTAVEPLPLLVDTGRFSFLPIHTPGHSRDHVVYLETSRGWLFSGDLYLGDRIKFFRSDERMDQQIRSLKTVLQYDFQTLFCAHNPAIKDGRTRLSRKLAYLEAFYGRVGHLKRKGWPRRAIARQMDQGRDRWVRLITMGNASFANMVRSAYRTA